MKEDETDYTLITSLSHPGVEIYGTLTEAQLRNRLEPEKGIFIAESPKVIGVALDAGMQPISLLCEERHIMGDAAPIIHRIRKSYGSGIPVYTGSRKLLASLTGYTLTRGVLCAMRRPQPPSLEQVCNNARRIVVIHGVVDSTNIGAIFRSAAALGIDGILLTTDSCDPLNRRPAARPGLLHRSNGAHRPQHLAGRSKAEGGAAPGHHHGYRGRRPAPSSHRGS